ncbi:MAG: hypothetical protein MUE44_13945 [Oscillatoriaceae cyanobacterium Prado104]|jgi:hypothetical protein|nr:hypothetical protein [Oscillatoriaceae cyanobacterium Prado104]
MDLDSEKPNTQQSNKCFIILLIVLIMVFATIGIICGIKIGTALVDLIKGSTIWAVLIIGSLSGVIALFTALAVFWMSMLSSAIITRSDYLSGIGIYFIAGCLTGIVAALGWQSWMDIIAAVGLIAVYGVGVIISDIMYRKALPPVSLIVVADQLIGLYVTFVIAAIVLVVTTIFKALVNFY